MARRRLSDAEKDARRRADRERLEHAARELLSSDGWKRWIRVRATNGLARYSLRNQWLIALECHRREITPTYVAGFRAFLDLNRCVRKGEKAIKILAKRAISHRMRVRVFAVSVRLGPVRTDGDVGGCGDSCGVCGEVCCGRLWTCV